MTDLLALLAPIRELVREQRVIVMLAEPDTYDTRPLDAMTRLLAAIEAMEALAEEWRYKGEFGYGPWQLGEGPDFEGYILDNAATELRTALAAALGSDTTNQEGTQ